MDFTRALAPSSVLFADYHAVELSKISGLGSAGFPPVFVLLRGLVEQPARAAALGVT